MANQKFDGKKFGKRPTAVDQAVPKKIYSTGANVSAASEDEHQNERDSSSEDLDDDEDDEDDTEVIWMMVIKGSPAAKGILTSDMAKRNRLQEEKMTKLQSPNFHVVYNLPKSMTEKQLKKLFIDAVTSRATKQKPVNQQIKFLKSIKKGKVVIIHVMGSCFC
ncbi:uncharacterized protein [Populus alba]|uniref:RNA recognition motif-containing family protein n=2 Tax=Populus TaxID=3689 RepID=A0A4U5NQ93_POPAL|nr:RNA-binding protein 28-like [Populus alba]XP_034902388.1 RNA-binding protein 28-like [Populus alba]TKR85070.1 RNA recognition motif-containing family protein [Populus alba]